MPEAADYQDEFMAKIAEQLITNLTIKDRSFRMKTYKNCFLGSDAVGFLTSMGYAKGDADAIALGDRLIDMGILHHVTKDHSFKNEALFYRFSSHEDFHGGHVTKSDGSKFSWADALFRPDTAKATPNLQPDMPEWDLSDATQAIADVQVTPLDEYNIKLLDNVHPANWKDPVATSKYNLVVIGAGAGGLVTSAGSAGVGAKVAIIEEHLMGGDCLNVGCVPSKAVIRCARAVYEARNAAQFGVTVTGVEVDFGKIMERMRKIRAQISRVDSCNRYASELGVDVFQGRGKFIDKNTIEVNGQQLKFAAAVIATGAAASIPQIPGLQDVSFLTNATFFNLTELPKRFGVIGTGVIGLELAQAMARFGSEVTVFGRSGKILEKEDRDAVEIVQKQLVEDGIDFKLKCQYDKIENSDTGTILIQVTNNGIQETVEVDELMIATGRTPNVRNLNLEAAGVDYDKKGVKVNDLLQTSTKNIFAVGDVCTQYKFTHVADFMARLVIRNALFFGSGKMSSLLIPWATFTEPEIAHVGLYESDMKKAGIKYQTFIRKLDDVDRAICDGQEEGFCKIYTKEGSDKMIGATIVAADAGNMISEISVAMQAGFGLGSLAYVIHPYPTQSESIRQCGDLYNRTRLTPFVKGMFRNLLAWRRN
ncbi:hypothetical protein BSKO_07816 [Bryopsis sp. KO-2023]|nr:hypothetical protein BSKO_07816 [Bryopsis sp. KO-2023]